jgi:hypothetical protein
MIIESGRITTAQTVEQVADQVGYADGVTLRTLRFSPLPEELSAVLVFQHFRMEGLLRSHGVEHPQDFPIGPAEDPDRWRHHQLTFPALRRLRDLPA